MDRNNGNAQQENPVKAEAEQQISEIENKVAKKKSEFWKEVKEWVVALLVAALVAIIGMVTALATTLIVRRRLARNV